MDGLRAFIESDVGFALAASGFLIGFAFGAMARAANFCAMGAIADWRTSHSLGRLGAFALAMAVAIAGTQILDAFLIADVSRTMYLAPQINWAGAILGGLIFGFGMVLAGGCASRNLVRSGGGDLRGLVVMVTLAIAAFATISGILGPLRADLETATALSASNLGVPTMPAIAELAGMAPGMARGAVTLLFVAGLLYFAFVRARVHASLANLAGGIGIGSLVVLGWMVTGLAHDDMSVRPLVPNSLSFVRPVADAIDWLERSTALGFPGFGAATVFGVFAGSLLASLASRSFYLQGFAGNDDLVRHLAGALAMGVGGVLALGCSIGQGLTGISTLSLQSVLAVTAIFAGANLGLARLERNL